MCVSSVVGVAVGVEKSARWPGKQVGGRGFDLAPNALGNGHSFHLTGVRVLPHAGGGKPAFASQLAIEMPQTNEVADDLVAHFFDEEFNAELLLELQRCHEIAARMNAGPANAIIRTRLLEDRHAQRAEERMLHAFHVAEEVREMHDASHVSLGELNALGDLELVRHG